MKSIKQSSPKFCYLDTVGCAIILAGGLGTRLQSAVAGLPKCMASVAGHPFLYYIINYLQGQGIEKFIFSLGYKHQVIEDFLNKSYPALNYQCSIEQDPLGTGGAIKRACQYSTDKNVLIVNGDTLFKMDVNSLATVHFSKKAECTVALKTLTRVDRYGVVTLDENNRITAFQEKQYYQKALINGGIYLLNKERFLHHPLPEKFSFEKDYLEIYYQTKNFYGCLQEGYFIDIGTPEDFAKAQTELTTA